ncbi:hypothetical protein AAY42_05320 [Flagellimonas eckloniae]|uniref:Uncharacterized protein n=2 Tax=Flagellimonas eckloniae TaxID=346185 RepID=A0A0Q1CKU2_9FLAO|nr:hypothetical protein AAY42_05320 [Allomuricauda eckloniae]
MQILSPVFVLVLGVSCKPKTFDSEKELFAYLKTEANGYHHEKVIGNISYALTYRPTDLLVKQELTEGFSNEKVDSLRKEYSNYLYFNLSMSANNQELLNATARNRNEFGVMVNQLVFGMGDKVHLISQKRDTIPMIDYVYPRMYGTDKSTNMLLVYPKEKKLLEQDYFFFSVQDFGFATGEVGFKIHTKPFLIEPQLNFDEIL